MVILLKGQYISTLPIKHSNSHFMFVANLFTVLEAQRFQTGFLHYYFDEI